MFLLKDLPKYECIQAHAARYPQIRPPAIATCLSLMRVASDILEKLEAYFAAHGLSQGRFVVLMLLLRTKTEPRLTTPSDLAARAGVTRATMTGLLDGLEREGLIRREQHSDDRRMLVVKLTQAGQDRLDALLPAYFTMIAGMTTELDDSELDRMRALLGRIETGQEAYAPTVLESASA